MQISEELNTIISYAREEAMRTGCRAICPDHLFLGILRHCDNEACRIMSALDANLPGLKRSVEELLFQENSIPYNEEATIGYDRATQNVLSLAVNEAVSMGSDQARSLHLLLALCNTPGCNCKSFLESIDIDAGTIRAWLKDNSAETPAPEKQETKVRIIGTFSIKPSEYVS